MYTIYLIEREDGLKYVGQTLNFKGRVSGHKKSPRFETYKIKSVEIIDYADDEIEAYVKEKYWISYHDTFNNGLNMTKTGGYNHKGDSIKFSTLGISYTKGTKWYNDGSTNIRVKEGKQPNGFVLGKITRNPNTEPVSQETRKKLSDASKGKVRYVKFTDDTIREMLVLYKSKPEIEKVGEYIDLSKTMILSYERAFCKKFAEKFNMTSNGMFGILRNKGGIAWGHIWNEVMGDEDVEIFINEKRAKYFLGENEVRSIFEYIKCETEKGKKDLKDIIENASIIFDIRNRYLKKLYYAKGGKKWNYIWRETIGSIDCDTTYIKNADVTETKVRNFFEDFLNFTGTKKDFYMKANEYGLSENKGRKLLYCKNKNGWKHIWDELNENRNID